MDSLNALNAFVYAAEAGSFKEAGRRLGLSSSAVGKAIARLEERNGVRLIYRSTRRITLTQEGRLLLESCRRIFTEIKNVEMEFAQSKGRPRGKLRVGMPQIGTMMMPLLGEFIQAYPDIELDLDFRDHVADVIDGGYDVVLSTSASTDSRLMSRSLARYRFEVVGSQAYFERCGYPATPSELSAHACIRRRCSTTGKLERWPFAASEHEGEFDVPTAASVNTFVPLITLIECGLGIGCVPDFTIRKQLQDGSLVRILTEQIEHSGAIRALWPSRKYLSPKLRAFLDFLAERLHSNQDFGQAGLSKLQPRMSEPDERRVHESLEIPGTTALSRRAS
jgi:DNA-binding transcriptional LysR family regulator